MKIELWPHSFSWIFSQFVGGAKSKTLWFGFIFDFLAG